jgi:hypothetical protein
MPPKYALALGESRVKLPFPGAVPIADFSLKYCLLRENIKNRTSGRKR